VADLAADEVHVAAVEVTAKVETGLFLAVPGTDEDTAVKARDVDGHIEGLGVAG